MRLRIYVLILIVAANFALAETRVSVMTYNVENLFDSADDPKVNDQSYLPLSLKQSKEHKKSCKGNGAHGSRGWECLFLDWSQARVDAKMKNLAAEILKAPGGKGPDIVVLAEVENRSVVEELNRKYLAGSGYTVTHMNTADQRGIDQAILSRYPLKNGEYRYHQLKVPRKSKRGGEYTKELRGILQGTFDVKGKTLHVLALHLPSQGSPFAERRAVLNHLNRLALSIPANDAVIAAGDFNVTSKEWQKEKVLPQFLEPIWDPAHLQNCKDCRGTYFYAKNREWSYLDWLLLRVDREKKPRWTWGKSSVRIVGAEGAKNPARFDPNTLQGASDHYPLYAELILK